MRLARCLLIVLTPFAVTACAPAYDDGHYADGYGRAYPGAIHGELSDSRSLDASSYGDLHGAGDQVFRTVSERDAYLSAVAAARRAALRDAEILRQRDRYRRAERDLNWEERDRDWAERQHRRAVWRDRQPVGTGPHDLADSARRAAELQARLASRESEQTARQARREQARLKNLSRIDRVQDRIDRIERAQRRQEARRARQAGREAEVPVPAVPRRGVQTEN